MNYKELNNEQHEALRTKIHKYCNSIIINFNSHKEILFFEKIIARHCDLSTHHGSMYYYNKNDMYFNSRFRYLYCRNKTQFRINYTPDKCSFSRETISLWGFVKFYNKTLKSL